MINRTNNSLNFKGTIIKTNAVKGKGKPLYTAVKGDTAHVLSYCEKGRDEIKTKVLNYDKEAEDQIAEIPNFAKGIVLNVINKSSKKANTMLVSVGKAFENAHNKIVVVKAHNAKAIEGTTAKPITTTFEDGTGIKQLIAHVPDNQIGKILKNHQAKKVFAANYHTPTEEKEITHAEISRIIDERQAKKAEIKARKAEQKK